jgi:hypothetical protein
MYFAIANLGVPKKGIAILLPDVGRQTIARPFVSLGRLACWAIVVLSSSPSDCPSIPTSDDVLFLPLLGHQGTNPSDTCQKPLYLAQRIST